MAQICVTLRVPISSGLQGFQQFQALMDAARADKDLWLDAVDGALRLAPGPDPDELRNMLRLAGSAYTVGPDDESLVHVVDPTLDSVVKGALSTADACSQELSHAWSRAYGREPDPSDAWDHAIKAIEFVLCPVVEPRNTQATLGSVIARLKDNPEKWMTTFPGPGDTNSIEHLVSTLRLIWPNVDRHGGGKNRAPTLAEARAVVALAAALIQCERDSFLVALADVNE